MHGCICFHARAAQSERHSSQNSAEQAGKPADAKQASTILFLLSADASYSNQSIGSSANRRTLMRRSHEASGSVVKR